MGTLEERLRSCEVLPLSWRPWEQMAVGLAARCNDCTDWNASTGGHCGNFWSQTLPISSRLQQRFMPQLHWPDRHEMDLFVSHGALPKRPPR